MDHEEVTDLDPEEAKLRQEMENTRSAMSEKLERLENKVAATVEGAANAVTDTVESVKGAVEGTVETVKESVQGTVEAVKKTFDLPRQVDRHPWAMMGGSVALGFAVGHFLGGRSAPSTQTLSAGVAATRKPQKAAHGNGWSGAKPAESTRPAARAEGPSLVTKLVQQFGPEIDKLKGLAVGALLGVVRDMVNKATPPEVGSQIAQVIDDITCKLGGKPISGPVSSYFGQDQPAEETGPPREKPSPVGAAAFPGRGGFERRHP